MHPFSSRRRALIASAVTAALVAAGVGLVAGPAMADTMVYQDVSDAFAAATSTESTFTLANDIDAHTQNLQLPAATNFVFDLAGSDLDLRQLTLGAGSTLDITDSGSSDPGTLTVSATAFNEGGIRTAGATLTIDGQVVVVSTAGASAAGIGGGNGQSAGALTISDSADVTATGGSNAAGMGGGQNGSGSVTISGDATVDATGGTNGAGIGGGSMSGAGLTSISGNADVTATGGSSGAGIGGGNTQGGGTVVIGGSATVHATGSGASGIGASGTAGVQSITIQGDADVTAKGLGSTAVGIGAGFGPSGQVTFDGTAHVTATGGGQAFGVGMGNAAIATGVDVLGDAVVTASGGLGAFGSTDDTFGDMTLDGEIVIPTGNKLTLPNPGDSITGTGSISGPGSVVNFGTVAIPDANISAPVTKNSNVHNYSVTFSANGGTLTPATPVRVLGTSFAGAGRQLPTGARVGYLLSGWKLGTAAFTANTAISTDTALVAQWIPYAGTLPVPTITGTTTVGSTLSADVHDSGWAEGTSFTLTWLRNGVAIAGAPHLDFYTLVGADAGKQISVMVTGRNPGQPTLSKISAKTAVIGSGAITGLSASITGPHQVGSAYSVSPTSSLPGAKYAYQWYVNGIAVAKATAASWIATAAAQNGNVSVKITATATGYAPASIVVIDTSYTVAGSFTSVSTPTIAGTVQVGQKLTAIPGAWTPAATFSYQWYRDGVPIPGATASTLTLPANAMGYPYSVRVLGSRAGYISNAEISSGTAPVLGLLTGAAPKITGAAKVGSILTAAPGAWTAGTHLDYQWVRVSGTTATDIAGATGTTYTVQAADKAKTIKLRITGSQADYGTLVKLSAATAKVP